MNNDDTFAIIREAVEDPLFLRRLSTNVDDVLTERGFAEPERREEVKRVMAALGLSRVDNAAAGSYQAQHDTTQETADSFKSALRDTVKQIER